MKILVTLVTFGLLISPDQVGALCDVLDGNGSQCYKIPNTSSKCDQLQNVYHQNDKNVTYYLKYKISENCDFNITETTTGETLDKHDYEIKECGKYLVIKKSYEGRFDFNFPDGKKVSVLLYDHYLHTTTIAETISKTLENPLPKRVNLQLNPGTKFYHSAQLGCAMDNYSAINMKDGTKVNCKSFNFSLDISKSMKNAKNEDTNFIQLTKKFSEACNNMYHGNTVLKINLTINARDQIDQIQTFKTDIKIHRSLTNMNPRLISVPFTSSFRASKLYKCLNLHPNSVHSNSSGVVSTYDKSKGVIDLNFTEILKEDRLVTVRCHPDIEWYLVITIQVVDHVKVSYMYIGVMATVVFLMCVCLISFLKHKGVIQCNANSNKPKYDYHEIVKRSTIVVNRAESESDADEELERSRDENRLLLEKAFGNHLNKVLKPFHCVEIKGLLGKGNFGKVYHGILTIGEYTKLDVAIKEAFSPEMKNDLIHEAKTMDRVNRNDYIVNLQGISYNEDHIYLLLEYW